MSTLRWYRRLVGRTQTRIDRLLARAQLRDRIGMIITIDRAGTERSIANQH